MGAIFLTNDLGFEPKYRFAPRRYAATKIACSLATDHTNVISQRMFMLQRPYRGSFAILPE
ncbi:MAG: hypothetical protein R3B96_18790 [Pirellulaceae bacterium]